MLFSHALMLPIILVKSLFLESNVLYVQVCHIVHLGKPVVPLQLKNLPLQNYTC